jgi:hypothetical protein
LDLDKPDGDVIRESEDGESGDDGCLRQKPYVDINVIPVARLVRLKFEDYEHELK